MTFPSKQLGELLLYVYESPRSDFYKHLWSKRDYTPNVPLTEATWSDVPLLGRKDITDVHHPSDRLFVELSEVDSLRSTSGTSGNKPLYLWRDLFPAQIYELYKKQGAKRMIGFYPLPNHSNVIYNATRSGIDVLFGNTYELMHAARYAAAVAVDTLAATPTLATVFGEYLSALKYQKEIRLITLYGGYCTDTTYTMLRELYPNAKFVFQYSSSESCGIIAAATEQCEQGNKRLHIMPEYFVESVDDELVVTSLELPHAFPLIRYRTGDAGYVDKTPCTCGNPAPQIVLSGRIGGDFITTAGGKITAEEIDRVLAPLHPHIENNFTVEVEEKKVKDAVTSKLHIYICKRTESPINDAMLSKQILDAFNDLRLSATFTLKDALRSGLSTTPEIHFMEKSDPRNKNPRIVMR